MAYETHILSKKKKDTAIRQYRKEQEAKSNVVDNFFKQYTGFSDFRDAYDVVACELIDAGIKKNPTDTQIIKAVNDLFSGDHPKLTESNIERLRFQINKY